LFQQGLVYRYFRIHYQKISFTILTENPLLQNYSMATSDPTFIHDSESSSDSWYEPTPEKSLEQSKRRRRTTTTPMPTLNSQSRSSRTLVPNARPTDSYDHVTAHTSTHDLGAQISISSAGDPLNEAEERGNTEFDQVHFDNNSNARSLAGLQATIGTTDKLESGPPRFSLDEIVPLPNEVEAVLNRLRHRITPAAAASNLNCEELQGSSSSTARNDRRETVSSSARNGTGRGTAPYRGFLDEVHQGSTSTSVESILSQMCQDGNDNTTKTYRGACKEFIEWCSSSNQWPDVSKCMVTEEKLLLFLESQVVGRESKRKRSSAAGSNQVVGIQTVKNYVNAIGKLWAYQRANGTNTNDHPRGPLIKSYLKYLSTREFQRSRLQHEDRAIGTVVDGYSTKSELHALSSAFFKTSPDNLQYRDRAMFLISHYALFRGNNIRMLEMADLLYQTKDDQGPTKFEMLLLLAERGKTNQVNKKEYGAMTRTKDVIVCPVGALALHFFHLFHVEGKSLPDLSSSNSWFTKKVFYGRNEDTEISASTHSKSVKKAINESGISTSKVTHIGRKGAVNFAPGVDDNHIRRLGRWNNQAMEMCYAGIPIEGVKGLAGFDKTPNSYYLPRAAMEPPDSLMSKVFPELDGWLAEWGRTDGAIDRSQSCDQFLRVMTFLRKVLIQDSVELKEHFKDLPIWDDEFFEDREYIQFENCTKETIQNSVEPSEASLTRLAPQLINYQNTHFASIGAKLAGVEAKLEEIQNKNTILSGMINRVIEGSVTLQFNLRDSDGASGNPAISSSSNPASLSTSVRRNSVDHEPDLAFGENAPTLAQNSAPHYKMSRAIRTVNDLWREWKQGIGAFPSIEQLENNWGTRWRSDPTESKFYNRRKTIIKEIQRLVSSSEQRTYDDAVKKLENIRVAKKLSLNGLQKEIAKETLYTTI
jgi:hypothetical protein